MAQLVSRHSRKGRRALRATTCGAALLAALLTTWHGSHAAPLWPEEPEDGSQAAGERARPTPNPSAPSPQDGSGVGKPAADVGQANGQAVQPAGPPLEPDSIIPAIPPGPSRETPEPIILPVLKSLPPEVKAALEAAQKQEQGAKPAAGSAQTPAQCFPVTKVVISGEYDLVPKEDIVGKLAPLALSCQGNDSVGLILKELNALYADAGYVTTQGYLPPQDIAKSGALTIQVTPGRIGEIRYYELREPYRWIAPRMWARTKDIGQSTGFVDFATRTGKWYDAIDDGLDRFTLLPPSVRLRLVNTIEPGEILQVDQLQDTIDALNNVPSQKAAAELAPGKQPATSDILIKNRIEDSFRVYAGYDTESVEGVDRLRFGTTVEKDNLIGINDTWSLTLRSGTSTNDLSGNVAVPYGNLTVRAGGGWQESTTDLAGLTELFVTTWNYNVGADWIVQRNKVAKTTLDMTLTHREQNRYINDFELQDQRVTSLSGGVSYSHSFERGSLYGRLGATGGLPILNAARDAEDIEDGVPRSQFWKLDGSIGANYIIPGFASLSTNWVGQYTDQTLYSDDQMTIGSRATVRGYSSGSLSADSGFYARNEIAFAVPAAKFLTSKSPGVEWTRAELERLNPYVFLDGGFGRDNANDLEGYRLSSGLGIRYGGPRASFDVGYAFRLAEDDVTPVDDADGETFINLRIKLF